MRIFKDVQYLNNENKYGTVNGTVNDTANIESKETNVN